MIIIICSFRIITELPPKYEIYIACRIVKSVARLTEQPGTGFGICPAHTFVEIDHDIFFYSHFPLPLIQEGQLSLSGESWAFSTGYPLRRFTPTQEYCG